MHRGYIKLWRKITDNELWLSEKFSKSQAWIDMIAHANYKPGVLWVRSNKVTIERGQLPWSERYMGTRWQWSRQKVRTFLAYLEKTSQIRPLKNNIISVICIKNYDQHQSDCTTDCTTDQTTERPQTGPQTGPILKNDKKDKKREGDRAPAFAPPKHEDVAHYCKERANGIDPQRFIDFYTARGWMIGKTKMKDWKAAVRTWEGRQKDFQKPETEKVSMPASPDLEDPRTWEDH